MRKEYIKVMKRKLKDAVIDAIDWFACGQKFEIAVAIRVS
jgi:hypothetical protein